MIAGDFLWLLQANDSAYPSGSYAHSLGLEELVESGVVKNANDLEVFLTRQIIPSLLAFELPFFAQAHAAARDGDFERVLGYDAELDAWRIPAEIRDASKRIGSQRLNLLGQLDPSPLVLQVLAIRPRCHHLIVTAMELSQLEVKLAARAFVFQTMASYTAASMKLIRIGQTACQQILRRALAQLEKEIDSSLSQSVEGWFNPLLEIASLRHAYAHSRLFIS